MLPFSSDKLKCTKFKHGGKLKLFQLIPEVSLTSGLEPMMSLILYSATPFTILSIIKCKNLHVLLISRAAHALAVLNTQEMAER